MEQVENSRGYRNRWIALAFMAIALLIISLDNTVLSLALPSIAEGLGSSASQLQWIVDAYILAIAGLVLTMGYLGDRLGRKTTLMVGLGLFALFSLGAALSSSTEMLIAMRAMMGIGTAIIMPATLSLLTATFRDDKERAQAIALWAATFSLGIGIGPLVGGWLLEHFSWSSVFYINIPIIAVVLVGGGLFIENSKTEHPKRIDILGATLSIGGLFALVYAIIKAGMEGWGAAPVLYTFGAAAVLLAAFILWEIKFTGAMLPLDFFKSMSFTGANVAIMLVTFGLTGAFYFLGQFLQSVQGYSPLEAGIRLLPIALVSFISAALSAKVAERIGTKLTVAIGIFIGAAGFFYLYRIIAVDAAYLQIAIALSIASLGIGMTMSPATNSVMGSIPVSQSGVGSAMTGTTRQVGGALGVAILGSILNATYLSRIDAVSWPAQLPARALEAIRNSIQGAHLVAQQVPVPQLSQMIVDKSKEAFTAGSADALLVTAIVLAITAVITLFILPSQPQLRGPKE
jgi:EmrB/QacA subfamily drug resistance transporter